MSYTDRQHNEFLALVRKYYRDIGSNKTTLLYFQTVANALVDQLVNTPDKDVDLESVLSGGHVLLKLKFSNLLKKLWNDLFDLGLKHQVEDILYTNPAIKKLWDFRYKKTKAESTFNIATLTDVALFEDRAENERLRLQRNVYDLYMQGFYDDVNNKGEMVGRYTALERINFLQSLNEISDVRRRAEATKKSFIQDNYMLTRQRVLGEDFAAKYDENTKKAVSKFLSNDIRYITALKANAGYARNATSTITKQLELAALEEKEGNKRRLPEEDRRVLYKRAELILKTEASFAYNVGKLVGYSSPLDAAKLFMWVTDWELNFSKGGYKNCEYCQSMNGRIFTAAQLIRSATQLDVGIAAYTGTPGTKTSFKNPSLPSIPAHPGCQCRFVRYIPPEQEEFQPEQEIVDVPKEENSLLLNAAVTGLLVGGVFLLSRGAAWKSAVKVANNVDLPVMTKPEKYVDAVDYFIDNDIEADIFIGKNN